MDLLARANAIFAARGVSSLPELEEALAIYNVVTGCGCAGNWCYDPRACHHTDIREARIRILQRLIKHIPYTSGASSMMAIDEKIADGRLT